MVSRSNSGRFLDRGNVIVNGPRPQFSNISSFLSSRLRKNKKNDQKVVTADDGGLSELTGDKNLRKELNMLNNYSVKNLLKYEEHKKTARDDEGGAYNQPLTPRRLIVVCFFLFFACFSTELWGGIKGCFAEM